MARRFPYLAASFALLFAFAGRASAQTPSPLQSWQYSSGIVLRGMFEPQVPTWDTVLGLSASYHPIYDGAKVYRITPGPTLDVRYKDRAFVSVGEGIGVNLIAGPGYRAGVALAYDLGRQVDEYPSHLHGLGNIEPAPVIKLFGTYVLSKAFPLTLRVDLRRVIGGANGYLADIGAYMPLPGSSRRLVMFLGPGITLADGQYMQHVFGVGLNQSARSGLPRFSAHGGLKAAGIGFSGTYFIAEHWLVNGEAALTRLLGSAAESPITEQKLERTIDLTLAYKF